MRCEPCTRGQHPLCVDFRQCSCACANARYRDSRPTHFPHAHKTETDTPAPCVRSSETSRESAKELDRTGQKNNVRQTIYEFIQWRGSAGSTCDEIEEVHNMRHQTASSAIRGLTKDAFIVDSGQTRRTRTNRRAVVWVVASKDPPKQMTFGAELNHNLIH